MEQMCQVTEPESRGVSTGETAAQGYAAAVLHPRSAQGIWETLANGQNKYIVPS